MVPRPTENCRFDIEYPASPFLFVACVGRPVPGGALYVGKTPKFFDRPAARARFRVCVKEQTAPGVLLLPALLRSTRTEASLEENRHGRTL